MKIAETNKTPLITQQEQNEKNTSTLISGLANTPKAFKYVLNIVNKTKKISNAVKLVFKLPISVDLAAKDLSAAFGDKKNIPSGLLRSGLLENLGSLNSTQTKAIITEVFKSSKVYESGAKDIKQDSLNALVDKTVAVISAMKEQKESLKAVGSLLADVLDKPSKSEKITVLGKNLSVLYSAVKDPVAQNAVHELIGQVAKTAADPVILHAIVSKVSTNSAVAKLLPVDESRKAKLVSSAINYGAALTQTLLPKQKETGGLVVKFTKYQESSNQYKATSAKLSDLEQKNTGRSVSSTKAEIDKLKEQKEIDKKLNNKSLKSLLTTTITLLKDPKVMAINNNFIKSNKHEIAAIIDQKLDDARTKAKESSTWKNWFSNKALSKVNGSFCVKLLQDTNTPKGLEAVDRLIQNPGVINGIRAAAATKNIGLLAKTMISGAAQDQAAKQTKISPPPFNSLVMRQQHSEDSKIMSTAIKTVKSGAQQVSR